MTFNGMEATMKYTTTIVILKYASQEQ